MKYFLIMISFFSLCVSNFYVLEDNKKKINKVYHRQLKSLLSELEDDYHAKSFLSVLEDDYHDFVSIIKTLKDYILDLESGYQAFKNKDFAALVAAFSALQKDHDQLLVNYNELKSDYLEIKNSHVNFTQDVLPHILQFVPFMEKSSEKGS